MSDRYSFSLTTFSPSGKLGQIEHALAAVSQGISAVGVCSVDGIVLVTERKLASPLIDSNSVEKISEVCSTVGIVYAGMGPDARVLLDSSRKSAQAYKRLHKVNPSVAEVARNLASTMHDHTHSGGVRPFGCSLLVAGHDDHRGLSLYQVDPSGSMTAWKATAIGRSAIAARTFLEKRHSDKLALADAVHTAVLALRDGIEGKLEAENLEIGIVSLNKKGIMVFENLSDLQKRDYLENLAIL
jgi:20S proteasome subunit alpha 2